MPKGDAVVSGAVMRAELVIDGWTSAFVQSPEGDRGIRRDGRLIAARTEDREVGDGAVGG